MVVRLGPAAEQHGANPANRGSANPPVDGASGTGGRQRGEDGIAVPGTDYRLETSEAARERDREVRLHEQAHLRSLGRYAASGVRYTTRTGPDGESYAVGGSIKADLSEVPGDPRATLQKAQAVQRAALAPGSPSGADMKVAAEAYRLARDAREALEETHGLDVRR
ncbi:MAG: putative metalloprotease CJM1_0395 family protein [Spirochaetota bacterium]